MDWQTPVALVIVLFAAVALIRSQWPRLSRKSGDCGSGCGGCSKNRDTNVSPRLVSLGITAPKHLDDDTPNSTPPTAGL